MSDDWVCLNVEEVKAVTDKAMLCAIEGEDVWLPFSQIAPEDLKNDYRKGDTNCSVSVTRWLAEQKGLL